MGLTVLVCGGRDYKDREKVFGLLDRLHIDNRITTIVHGAARGADTLAGAWAWTRKVAQKRYPADWETHGKAAGPIRNRTMLSTSKPDLVVAFPGGKGTLHMVNLAKAAKVPVMEVLRDGSVHGDGKTLGGEAPQRSGGKDQSSGPPAGDDRDRPAGGEPDAPAGDGGVGLS